jgi:Dullard-like phosphatase family protein
VPFANQPQQIKMTITATKPSSRSALHTGGKNVDDLKLNLGEKKSAHLRNDDGNQSPIASLVTQVSRTQPASPNSSSQSSTAYATPVAGNTYTPIQIDTTKKVKKTSDEDEALDMNAIQFSVSTPKTPSERTQVSPKTPPSPKRNKLLNYLLKSFSWCFSNNNQQTLEQAQKLEEEEVAEEESWSSKRSTKKERKPSVAKSPSSPTTNGAATLAAAPNTGRSPSIKNLTQKFLLGEQSERVRGKKCLVLDLDETLVHSCFQPIPNPDFVIPIEIEGTRHMVYVLKRPFVDDFLLEMSKVYEIVIFTASLSKYANPLLDQLDKHNVISARLFREHCTFIDSCYIKDLARLGRDITQTLIIDNSPTCYALQPQNAMAVSSWFDDKKDTQLQQMTPWLVKMGDQPTVYDTLQEYRMYYSQNGWNGNQNW